MREISKWQEAIDRADRERMAYLNAYCAQEKVQRSTKDINCTECGALATVSIHQRQEKCHPCLVKQGLRRGRA